MTDKAYIVANEQQEREVLEKLERAGLKWKGFSQEPTQWLPTRDTGYGASFPYILFGDDVVSWCSISEFELKDDYEIVFDGRKEQQMSEKYVVSQEFMNKLEEWRKNNNLINNFVGYVDLGNIPEVVKDWWIEDLVDTLQTNNRLIAILRWVNGEDIFEVEKPKKWAVRSKETDVHGDYRYVQRYSAFQIDFMGITASITTATKFDTKEEAESWANAHQEVVEVVDV